MHTRTHAHTATFTWRSRERKRIFVLWARWSDEGAPLPARNIVYNHLKRLREFRRRRRMQVVDVRTTRSCNRYECVCVRLYLYKYTQLVGQFVLLWWWGEVFYEDCGLRTRRPNSTTTAERLMLASGERSICDTKRVVERDDDDDRCECQYERAHTTYTCGWLAVWRSVEVLQPHARAKTVWPTYVKICCVHGMSSGRRNCKL